MRWWQRLRTLYAVRAARDEDTRRTCRVVMVVAAVMAAFVTLAIFTVPIDEVSRRTWFVVFLGLPAGAAAFALGSQSRDRPAVALMTAYLFLAVTYVVMTDGPLGQRFGLMIVAVLAVGSVSRTWVTVTLAMLFVIEVLAIAWSERVQALAEIGGLLQAPHAPFLRQVLLVGGLIFLLRRTYDRLYAEVGRQEDARKATLAETGKLNDSLERLADERTQHLSATRDRVAAIANDVAVDLQSEIDLIHDKLARVRRSTVVTDPERLADLGKATLAAQRLSAMVANLVGHARLGRVALNPREIDMNALAHDVVEQSRSSPEGARVAWTVEALPATRGDPVLIRSVLENLVANAVKFSARRAHPEVHIGYAGGELPGPLVSGQDGRYFVEDNGAGFDPGYSDRLFAPFQRLHSRGEYEGQGIGLANVRSIVERHGGDVVAWGAVDGGARFSFSLPSTRKAARPS
jgi:signal transduction histidine kinase